MREAIRLRTPSALRLNGFSGAMPNEAMVRIAPALRMKRMARGMPALWNVRAGNELGGAENGRRDQLSAGDLPMEEADTLSKRLDGLRSCEIEAGKAKA